MAVAGARDKLGVCCSVPPTPLARSLHDDDDDDDDDDLPDCLATYSI